MSNENPGRPEGVEYPEEDVVEEGTSRYSIDPDRARKKAEWYGDVLRLVAIEITYTVGDVSQTIRYEFEDTANA